MVRLLCRLLISQAVRQSFHYERVLLELVQSPARVEPPIRICPGDWEKGRQKYAKWGFLGKVEPHRIRTYHEGRNRRVGAGGQLLAFARRHCQCILGLRLL